MKKTTLLIFALAAMIFAFSGCSDDDDFSLVGTWTHHSTEITFSIMGFEQTEEEEGEGTVTFNDDGTGYSTSPDLDSEAFDWFLDGDKLTVTDSEFDTSIVFTLTTMTNSRVVAEVDNIEDFDMDFDDEDMDEDFDFSDMDLKVKFILVK